MLIEVGAHKHTQTHTHGTAETIEIINAFALCALRSVLRTCCASSNAVVSPDAHNGSRIYCYTRLCALQPAPARRIRAYLTIYAEVKTHILEKYPLRKVRKTLCSCPYVWSIPTRTHRHTLWRSCQSRIDDFLHHPPSSQRC